MAEKKTNMQDALTGCRSYEAFCADVDALLKSSSEQCEDLSLVMVDIDKFLGVNETMGHDAGDAVLKAVAAHLTESLPGGTVYRYGGDQFAALLPGSGKEAAFLLTEKAREAWQTKPGHMTNGVTVSAGIACCPEDGSRASELVRKSEGALFRAKAGGANRVCLSREEKMVTKTSHYTYEQLQRLAALAKKEGMGEAVLLREALDDLLKKYDF